MPKSRRQPYIQQIQKAKFVTRDKSNDKKARLKGISIKIIPEQVHSCSQVTTKGFYFQENFIISFWTKRYGHIFKE